MLFEDDDPEAGEALRSSIVAPANDPPVHSTKVHSLRTADGLPTHSFATLLKDLATLTRNRVQPKILSSPPFDTLARPSQLQQKALSLLDVSLAPSLCRQRQSPLQRVNLYLSDTYGSQPKKNFGLGEAKTFSVGPLTV